MSNINQSSSDSDEYCKIPVDYRTEKQNVKYGKVTEIQYYSSTVGKKRNATIVLPPDYTTEKQYPVLYLLHGLGQDNTQWVNDGNADIILGNMLAENTAQEMILVLPNCRARENDSANPVDAFTLEHYKAFDNFKNDLVNDLMPFIRNNYSVRTNRENTAIAGFSMGGREALYIGISMQENFGYIAAFCPAPGIFAYSMNNVTENGLFEKKNFKIKKEYRNDTLLFIAGGKNDTIVTDWPQKYHDALAANNVKHVWYTVSGGHDFDVVCRGYYHFVSKLFQQRI